MDFSAIQIIFLLSATVLITSAVLAVTVKNMVHAALWMVLSFFVVGVLFVLMGTPFFAVIQVVIYIGAIAVLIMFVIMLTASDRKENHENQTKKRSLIPALISLAIFFTLSFGIMNSNWITPTVSRQVDDTFVQSLGQALVEPAKFGLVFELASILLLVAMIGAIYLAQDRGKGEDA
jgi:NADH-quinone oxidoreductase subunit J